MSSTSSGAAHRGLPADFGVSRGVNSSDNHQLPESQHLRFHVDFFILWRLIENFPRECTETFQEGHRRAFEFFRAVPKRVTYDNTKIAVVKVIQKRGGVFTREFLRLPHMPVALPLLGPVSSASASLGFQIMLERKLRRATVYRARATRKGGCRP